jgi:hypothetical protein
MCIPDGRFEAKLDSIKQLVAPHFYFGLVADYRSKQHALLGPSLSIGYVPQYAIFAIKEIDRAFASFRFSFLFNARGNILCRLPVFAAVPTHGVSLHVLKAGVDVGQVLTTWWSAFSYTHLSIAMACMRVSLIL